MNSRERLLRVFRRQEPDRIPWSPLIDGYYLAGLEQPKTDLEAGLDTGADLMLRKVPVWLQSVFLAHEGKHMSGETLPGLPLPPGISRRTEIENGILKRTYETPRGTLTERWEFRDSSPYIPFPREYLIKTAEDIGVYRYLVEREDFVPYEGLFQKLTDRVGGRGLVTVTGPHTPVQHLLLIHMGVERFYFLLQDSPDRLTALMDLMHERNKEIYRIIRDSPAEVVIEYENTGTTYVSPRIYEKLERPPMDEYADILHERDKVFLVHMCGRLRGLAGLIGRGRQDGSCDIATRPTGDWELADARKAWPDKLIVGGLDSITLATGTPVDVKSHVRATLSSIVPGDGIVLGSSDAVPMGTPPENLRAVTEAVEELGQYPLEGSRFEPG